jgi:hypothetical protein
MKQSTKPSSYAWQAGVKFYNTPSLALNFLTLNPKPGTFEPRTNGHLNSNFSA